MAGLTRSSHRFESWGKSRAPLSGWATGCGIANSFERQARKVLTSQQFILRTQKADFCDLQGAEAPNACLLGLALLQADAVSNNAFASIMHI